MTKSLQECRKIYHNMKLTISISKSKSPEVSFHETEKIPELKKKWLKVLKRKGTRQPIPSHRVCSEHFVKGKESILRGQRKCSYERYVKDMLIFSLHYVFT